MIMFPVLIRDCVCRRPSWIPKTQPNGSSAVVWLSFWFSTRFTRKNFDYPNANYLYGLFSVGELRFGLEVSTSRHCAFGCFARKINFTKIFCRQISSHPQENSRAWRAHWCRGSLVPERKFKRSCSRMFVVINQRRTLPPDSLNVIFCL